MDTERIVAADSPDPARDGPHTASAAYIAPLCADEFDIAAAE